MKKILLVTAVLLAFQLSLPAVGMMTSVAQAQDEEPKPAPKPKPKPEPEFQIR
jgi:hypothetical protein